ncbi:hypothetical protein LCGC14_0460900 [marine sediment metagenome]|uniref:Uncharacterized protein n=1 Tax=marine sediment metagenome TaxID=412755 RepID=A0A0F9VNX7_9ZZZZ|nr:hypothetical protein [bacterium]
MEEHDCLETFMVDSADISDTKYVSMGHCSICMKRMLKVYRYQGTYDRENMKKLVPKKEED